MGLYAVSIYLLIATVTLAYLWLRRHYSYWERKGLVYDKPRFFYGNLGEVRRTKALRDPFYEYYMKYKGAAPLGGFYLFVRHAVILLDLDLVKNVLIKDFANFASRGNYYNDKDDPLSAHLFNLDGAKWRNLRAKLTPTFTSGKMKFMFPTIVQVGEQFIEVLKQSALQQTVDGVEMKELLSRFTTDVIGTCAFGLECNSLKDPDTRFRVMGREIFTKFRHKLFVIGLVQAFPEYARKLSIKMVPDHIHNFFMDVVNNTVEYREREMVKRNDFMNLLLELKNNTDSEGITINEIAAQAFIFFVAGFETSSSTMGFSLYELAMNPDIQEKARQEVNEVYARHEGKLTYEGMRDMKYLLQVLRETMRLYSIVTVLVRKALADYPVPNSNKIIEKGTVVMVPADAIHRDPDIYPKPEVFDPARFTPSEMEKRHPMAYLPFGDGPRNCIGMRFGEMQALVGLAMLLRNFRFSPAKGTSIPMEIDKQSFILAAKGGMLLKVEAL